MEQSIPIAIATITFHILTPPLLALAVVAVSQLPLSSGQNIGEAFSACTHGVENIYCTLRQHVTAPYSYRCCICSVQCLLEQITPVSTRYSTEFLSSQCMLHKCKSETEATSTLLVLPVYSMCPYYSLLCPPCPNEGGSVYTCWDETPVPLNLAQRLSTKAMLLGPSTPQVGEGQTCSACQKHQSILHIILESMVIAP